MSWWWVVLVTAVVVGLGLWLSWTANRLDRMHHRIELARTSLDAQLLRRSGTALELVASEVLDKASALLLYEAAHEARAVPPDRFEAAESALSEVLRAVFADEEQTQALRRHRDVGPLVHELAADCRKVELARRFHNDVVVSARSLRSRKRVQWLRLAGHAAELQTVDLDDVPPQHLVAD